MRAERMRNIPSLRRPREAVWDTAREGASGEQREEGNDERTRGKDGKRREG